MDQVSETVVRRIQHSYSPDFAHNLFFVNLGQAEMNRAFGPIIRGFSGNFSVINIEVVGENTAQAGKYE